STNGASSTKCSTCSIARASGRLLSTLPCDGDYEIKANDDFQSRSLQMTLASHQCLRARYRTGVWTRLSKTGQWPKTSRSTEPPYAPVRLERVHGQRHSPIFAKPLLAIL